MGGRFRVAVYSLSNIETVEIWNTFDWDPDVLEAVGADDVRGAGRFFNSGHLINFDGEGENNAPTVWHYVTPEQDPIGGIRLTSSRKESPLRARHPSYLHLRRTGLPALCYRPSSHISSKYDSRPICGTKRSASRPIVPKPRGWLQRSGPPE